MERRHGRFGKRTVTVLVVVLGFLVGEASGSATMIGGTEFNIEYWAGSGPKQAVLVIDFGATGGECYSFGYRWDGDAKGFDMIEAIAEAGDLGYAATTFPGFGTYIDNFSYRSEAGNVDYWWQYFIGTPSAGSVAWTSASEGMSTRALADGSIDGWYNSFDPGVTPRVPEPASALLLAAATALLRRRAACTARAELCTEAMP